MAIRLLESGGQYYFNSIASGPGIWSLANGSSKNTAPAYNGSTYAWNFGNLKSNNLGGDYATLIAGARLYLQALGPEVLIEYYDSAGQLNCGVHVDGSGRLFFQRNGVTIGTSSTNALTINVWYYLEFKAIFATGATGTCEAVVNGVTWLTSTSVQNAVTNANSAIVLYGASAMWGTDFYCLDTGTGINTTYLGDITVAELYPNGAGTNAQWTANPAASFTLTSVANASGGTTVYTGTITAGTANAYQGYYFTVTGFVNGANNGTWLCTASSTTTLTLLNASGVSETHAATAAFQAIIQAGIHGGINDSYATTNVGTRPNNDVTYLSDSTTNHLVDYAHQALTLTGTIAGISHVLYARKDDAGPRSIAPIVVQGGSVSETGTTIALSSSYSYYKDILEADPNTSVAWLLANLNSATFGVKEIT